MSGARPVLRMVSREALLRALMAAGSAAATTARILAIVLPHGFGRSKPSSQEIRPLPFASHHSMVPDQATARVGRGLPYQSSMRRAAIEIP